MVLNIGGLNTGLRVVGMTFEIYAGKYAAPVMHLDQSGLLDRWLLPLPPF
ncbi:hypothetical protein [Nitrosospira sp. Nsp2]|nr:hypothetical protein [Nitrosospira sp. Nsp2]